MNSFFKVILIILFFGLFTFLNINGEVMAQTCSGTVSVNQDNSSCSPKDPIYGHSCNINSSVDTPSCVWDIAPGGGFACGRWWLTRAGCGCSGLTASCSEWCAFSDTEWYDNGCAVTTPAPTIAPGCNAGSWTNVSCGISGCNANEMYQTRTTSPAGCTSSSRCVTTASCGSATNFCSFTVPNVTLSGSLSSTTITAAITDQVGSTISRIDFTSGDSTIASVTSPDLAAPFRTTITAQSGSPGKSTQYVAVARMADGVTTCSYSANITVTNPVGWFQIGSNIMARGNIRSNIPANCVTDPLCSEFLVTNSPGEAPGLAVSGANVSAGGNGGQVSSNNRRVQGLAGGNRFPNDIYDYDFFFQKINSPIYTAISDSMDPATIADFLANSAPYRGWHVVQLPCTSGTANTGNFDMLNRRTILFVDCDLEIGGTIDHNDNNGGVIIVTSGDIDVDPEVGGPCDGVNPAIKATIHTDRSFNTGHTDDPVAKPEKQLYLKGSVHADSINLERDLADNSTQPAECFEQAPNQLIQYPSFMSGRSIIWREVAP